MSFKSLIGVAVALSLTAGAATAWGQSPVLAWMTQPGTYTSDKAYGVAVDSAGNAYITGYTYGSLGGTTQVGEAEPFLFKYSSTGSVVWKTQLGSPIDTQAYGVAVDSAGNAYITGIQGYGGVFLAKYSSAGTLGWKTQFVSSGTNCAKGVAVDSAGNAYITGYTSSNLAGTNQGGYDAFLAKYDAAGSLTWKTQLGSSADDASMGVAVDSAGNAYITGYTKGSLGGTNQGFSDAFLAKYNSTGSLVWIAQLGSPPDEDGYGRFERAYGVAVDSAGNAYITGDTEGSLGGMNQGFYDAFLAKYDSTGNLVWVTQFGGSGDDEGRGVALDSVGNAYITGHAESNLGGTHQGGWKIFLVMCDSTGSLAWTTQLGSSRTDEAYGVAVDSVSGSAYVTGYTTGDLGGTNQGGEDAFIVKYDVPEPATFALLALGGLVLIRRWR